MKRSNLNKWLEALRSDKYTQISGVLANAECTGGCCLGIFLIGPLGLKPDRTTDYFREEEEDPLDISIFSAINGLGEAIDETTVLPRPVTREHGFYTETGGAYIKNRVGILALQSVRTSKGICTSLAEANDRGVPFAEIADIIEANPTLFFTSIEEDV